MFVVFSSSACFQYAFILEELWPFWCHFFHHESFHCNWVRLITAAIVSLSVRKCFATLQVVSVWFSKDWFLVNPHFKTYRVQKFPGVINNSSTTKLQSGQDSFYFPSVASSAPKFSQCCLVNRQSGVNPAHTNESPMGFLVRSVTHTFAFNRTVFFLVVSSMKVIKFQLN